MSTEETKRIENIKALAKAELEHEQFRELVEQEKTKLKEKKSLWDKLFSFKIIILRKDK